MEIPSGAQHLEILSIVRNHVCVTPPQVGHQTGPFFDAPQACRCVGTAFLPTRSARHRASAGSSRRPSGRPRSGAEPRTGAGAASMASRVDGTGAGAASQPEIAQLRREPNARRSRRSRVMDSLALTNGGQCLDPEGPRRCQSGRSAAAGQAGEVGAGACAARDRGDTGHERAARAAAGEHRATYILCPARLPAPDRLAT